MPIYDIEIPGLGKFEVNSPNELTESEAVQAAISQQTSKAEPSDEPSRGGYFQRAGRQLSEAGSAALDIPSSAAGLVVGGDTGRGRFVVEHFAA